MSLRELTALMRADRRANSGYPKSRFVLFGFRLTQWARALPSPFGRLIYVMVAAAYRISCEWLLGIEIPSSTHIGAGLRLRHGVGVVINPAAVIGRNVLIRHNVTIGNRRRDNDCPTIGDDVEIGAGAVLIGAITIGDRARIGTGAIVLDDVGPDAVAVSPAAIILPAKELAP